MRDDKFDLEQFKAGRDAITRSGRVARFIAYVDDVGAYCLVAVVDGTLRQYQPNGSYSFFGAETDMDLVKMAPNKTKTVTIYAAYVRATLVGASESEDYMAKEYKGCKIIPMTGEL